MKKQYLLVVCILSAVYSYATQYTVNNNGSNTAQFATIQSAVDSAADGDTIYVMGSPNIYPYFTIDDKKLTVIGPGWSPDKNIPLTAIVNGCGMHNHTAIAGSASGSELNGLVFSSGVSITENFGGQAGISNVKIIRCYFKYYLSHGLAANNMLYESCIFTNTIGFNNSQTYTNILFQNNVFEKTALGSFSGFIINLQNGTNVLIDHNLFYSNNNTMAFYNSDFFTISNNIFVKMNLVSTFSTSISYSTFNNNITYNCGGNHDTAWAFNNNTGTGNIPATSPQLSDSTAVNNATFTELLDFTVLGGPAKNGGSDGKDIGLLFDPTGSLNWSNARNSRFPRITVMNITTPTVAPGGNLSVNVEAKVSQ